MKRAWLLVALLAVAACASSNEGAKPDAGAPIAPPGPKLHEKPFSAHFDALINRFLPHDEFPPGVTAVWAPIHSGVNATLYFMALRDRLPRVMDKEHEVCVFIVQGEGTLDLAGGKSKHIEGGFLIRIPPGFCYGFTPSAADPLKAIVVVAPSVQVPIAAPSNVDDPNALGWIYCEDVIPQVFIPAKGHEDTFAARKAIDTTRRTTLQLAAIQRDRIPDHRHNKHDETVIIFFQQGFGFLRMDETVNPTQAIQVAHIPAGTIHSFEHKGDGQVRAVSIFTPGHDGTDNELVKEKWEDKAAPEYTPSKQGEFVEPHHNKGALPTRGDERPEIRVGPR